MKQNKETHNFLEHSPAVSKIRTIFKFFQSYVQQLSLYQN